MAADRLIEPVRFEGRGEPGAADEFLRGEKSGIRTYRAENCGRSVRRRGAEFANAGQSRFWLALLVAFAVVAVALLDANLRRSRRARARQFAMARFVSKFRLTVPAGKATPQPPVGSAFGQRGLNIMNFCKAFNDQTSHIVENTPMQVLISTRADRSFEFVVNSPRTTWFLKRAAGIAKGANFPKRETCGRLSVKALYEIAKVKQADANLKDLPLEKICRSIVGTAKSMGLEIYDPRNV